MGVRGLTSLFQRTGQIFPIDITDEINEWKE